jgi:two-component system response regulator MprA
MEQPKILVIDDDENITSFLKRALAYAGFVVATANSGAAGLQCALNNPPDVVILDVLMPEMDGWTVCGRLRACGDVPILMLTAKDEVADRVYGLEAGADDYLIKPFALEELIARLRALLRRRVTQPTSRARFADLTIDQGTRQVWRGERAVELTAKEFDLLAAFMRHPRQVLSREQLLSQVWGFDFEVETHVLEVYVRYLREKLEAGGEPRLIHTRRGAGYVLMEQSG